MPNPRDLNPNDFSDSDWFEFTGGLQRPFQSQSDQDLWIEMKGRVLPDSEEEINEFVAEMNREPTPEERARWAIKKAALRRKFGLDPEVPE